MAEKSLQVSQDNTISSTVLHLATAVYKEFKLIIEKHGEGSLNQLMPVVIHVLETLDAAYVEKQSLNSQCELYKTEQSELLFQLEREKRLKAVAEKRVLFLEDGIAAVQTEANEKIEPLEAKISQCEIKLQCANEHILRLEAREVELRKEAAVAHERYAELLRVHVDNMERVKTGVDKHTYPKTTRKSVVEEVLESTKKIGDSSNEVWETIGEVDCGGVRRFGSPTGFLSYSGGDANDYETVLLCDSASEGDDGTTESVLDEAPDNAADGDLSSGMAREVENLIKENVELIETKNALNVVKDDLIKRLDTVHGEKLMLEDQVHRLQLAREELRTEANRLARLLNDSRNENDNILAQLRLYEEADESDSSKFIRKHRVIGSLSQAENNHVNSTKCDDSTVPATLDQELEAIDCDTGAQQSTTLREDKTVGTEGSHQPQGASCQGEVYFTRREMARVVRERNFYKERLLELQEAVRFAESLRANIHRDEDGCFRKQPTRAATPTSDGTISPARMALSLLTSFQAAAGGLAAGFSELLNESPDLAIGLPGDVMYVYRSPSSDNRVTSVESTERQRSSPGIRNFFDRLFGQAAIHTTETVIGTDNEFVRNMATQTGAAEDPRETNNPPH